MPFDIVRTLISWVSLLLSSIRLNLVRDGSGSLPVVTWHGVNDNAAGNEGVVRWVGHFELSSILKIEDFRRF